MPEPSPRERLFGKEDCVSSLDESRVTLAEIARIAGVGRAAVSNWRRRHSDFPSPVGGTDASPEFLLDNVASWLRSHDKLRDVGQLERLWPLIEALGERSLTAAVVAAAAKPFIAQASSALDEISSRLTPAARDLAGRAIEVAERQGPRETFEFLFGRWVDTNVRQLDVTPEPLAQLMARVAMLALGELADDAATFFDPACGTGSLLAAAARWSPAARNTLIGVDTDVSTAAIGAARLAFECPGARTDIRAGDSLRADPCSEVRADIVVSTPPWNERDWGHDQLVTDPRWAFGLPPRTESELAWVQHSLSRLRPGGVAVLLLPPAVAGRRAGRRIRAELVRSRALKGLIALPAGIAPPYGVSLNLWVLQAPGPAIEISDRVFVMDASSMGPTDGARSARPEWARFVEEVVDALRAVGRDDANGPQAEGGRCVLVPALDLLDEQVDLSPTRHAPISSVVTVSQLNAIWNGFSDAVAELGAVSVDLEHLVFSNDQPRATSVTLADLENAGVLTLRSGAAVETQEGPAPPGAMSVLTVFALLGHKRINAWIDLETASRITASPAAPAVARDGDIVLVGVERLGRSSWVHEGPPVILGPQLFVIGHDPKLFDGWFLAGCLGAASNARQASSRATTSTKIDVRRLRVLQLPLEEQRVYGQAFRKAERMRQLAAAVSETGDRLVREVTEMLAAGRLDQPSP